MDRETTKPKVGQILLTESAISACIASLAEQIKAAYKATNKVIVLVLLDGAKRFADELFGCIDLAKFELRYLRAKSYNGAESCGQIEINGRIGDVSDAEVLIVDDIYDRGRTLSGVLQIVKQGHPQSIRTCVLLEKQTTRTELVSIDFVAAQVPDCFVVGYGLDYDGQYRELPFIASVDIVSV